MSNRSIIELNHDFVHFIKDYPEDFVGLLVEALNSSGDREWERLRRFGIKHAITTHHSDERKVVTPWKEYPL